MEKSVNNFLLYTPNSEKYNLSPDNPDSFKSANICLSFQDQFMYILSGVKHPQQPSLIEGCLIKTVIV